MDPKLTCLLGFHRWRWFCLYDPGELDAEVHASQCQRCGRLVGGWRGVNVAERT